MEKTIRDTYNMLRAAGLNASRAMISAKLLTNRPPLNPPFTIEWVVSAMQTWSDYQCQQYIRNG